jgi:glycosyltransferase involved in cell wall biosynthesis
MGALLSLVIPVFNEAGSLESLLAEITAAMLPLGRDYEVVFVDDGSTDGSFAILEGLAAADAKVRVVKLRRNFGKAAALTQGFAVARVDIIVTMDGDRQDDPGEIVKLLDKLEEGYDLVSGWKESRQDPITKRLPSRLFNWSVRTSTGIALHDFNCGLKSYRREVIEHLNIYGELHRYIPVVAGQQGFRVAEVKVAHRRRVSGSSKYGWQRFARGYLDLLTVLFLGRYQHRPQHLFGGIGTLMILVGAVVDAYLVVLKILGQAIGQRPLLVLGTLLIIVGIQLLSVGLLSELIANSRAREGGVAYQVERVLEGRAAGGRNDTTAGGRDEAAAGRAD